MTLKIGLIGCSRVAKNKIIPAVHFSDFISINAVGSRTNSKAKQYSKEIGCKTYGNYEDVIASDIDCVYISLPDGLHEKWAIKAAEAGLHILCEKSSTTSYESAKNIINACKLYNTRILECFSFRFHPQHKKVLQLIEKNELGKIYNFIGNFGYPKPDNENIRLKKELGGGILNDACCYPICASRIIFNEEPIGVMSNLIMDPIVDIDISASVFLMYKDKNAYAESGFDRNFKSNYEVWGSKGNIMLNRAYAVPNNFETQIYFTKNDNTETIKIDAVDQTFLMLKTFYEEIFKFKKSSFNFEEDLLKQAKILEAARLSSKKKKIIYLDEID
ncbi:NDP-hexose-3-ketoreductase [Nitrosopumilus zosterae]|uniref:NDP-hexose-3-ketoreductase n=1 Tax=Nitrosopumilus zosterae TaxID=718286 RepID=A0A2S2KU46_9ARCH|nr:Gfo/Idh/MocA family oxidoreductase [Nitrosopumilus zosterae]BDQ31824.1 Gfo/Idh/MocA family oxidoreductase [Nitrosopumilus zosterae]GBH35174.1 NDP-hexose-3-ketoreductase [Nitrosopumilus zosterae]